MTHRRPPANRPGLVSFLLARVDEDMDAALAAEAATARYGGRPPDTVVAVSAHRNRHDPSRALREAAAKRAVARLWLDVLAAQLRDPHLGRSIDAVEAAVTELAAVYADHPDFQPAWHPGTPHPSITTADRPGSDEGPFADNVIPFPVAARPPFRSGEP